MTDTIERNGKEHLVVIDRLNIGLCKAILLTLEKVHAKIKERKR